MTDWIKCSHGLPPKDSDQRIIVFSRGSIFKGCEEREFYFLSISKNFVLESGQRELNHSYTWWMPIPEAPNGD
jgi:Protein of unknown function (DUF551)